MAGNPAAFLPSAFLNSAFQTGGITPPTPPELVPGAGKGKGRRYIKLSDGSRREIRDDDDLRRIVRALVDAREEAENRPRKVSRKIRPRKKPNQVLVAGMLQNFASWDTLNAELRDLELIEERFLWDLVLAIAVREMINEDNEEFMLLLQVMA